MSNKQKNFRRILTFVLAVVLALGFLSTVAFTVGAEDGSINFDDLIAAGFPSGECGENVRWVYTGSQGLLMISGIGAMEVEQDTPWDAYKESITTVVIEEGVTTIDDFAFSWCTNLANVTIPNSITSIGTWAFYNCEKLKNVTIPNGVTTIGDGAFYFCFALESVAIPDSVTDAGNYTFYGCSAMTSLNLGEGITKIGERMFESCTKLESVVIGNKITDVGISAFRNCTELADVTIGNGIKTIGDAAFENCTALKNVYYSGTQEQWNAITIGADNACLTNAMSHVHTHRYTAVVTKPTCTAEGYTTYSCGCGDIYKADGVKALDHNYAAATCTKAKTCTRCKATSGKALDHNYAAATCTKAKTCKTCGATSGKALGHSYKTTTTKATLKKNGKVVKQCTVCDTVASSTTIKYAKTFKLSKTSYTYDGKAKKPSVTVKDSAGKTLKKDVDYTVSYSSGCKKVGEYKVTIKMKGNYTGTKTLTFKIKAAKSSTCSFKLSDTSFTYNGKVKTPKVTVKNAAGKTLKKNTDYTVSYAKGRKNVGTYKVTIKMKGNYTGTKTLTFKIVPKAASINKLTAKSKAITVKLNRSLQQSTGYEVQYSTKKTFKSADEKLIKSYKTSSTTLSKLKAKTTYYVRVRTYKTVSGTKIYSNWSSYKSIKTK